MGNGIRIARLFGIEIEIQPSWFLILALFVWSFATSWFGDSGWSTATVWSVAVVTALLLFASVLLHELAHSLVARAQGIRVRSISLFLLGGVSTLEEEASSPGREALMAAAGPGASAAVAAITWFAAGAIPGPEQLVAMLVALAWINAVLTVFNLLPGFPLDGGRVLRALVWKLTGDRARATRIAAGAGLVVGWLLIAGGALMAFTGSLGGGIWTAFIGWTMVQAAKAIGAQSRTGGAASAAGARFSGVTVAALMTPPRGWAPGSATVDRAAEEYFAAFGARYLPVVDDEGRLEGVADAEALQRTAPDARATTPLRAVMTPYERLSLIAPDAPADEALTALRSGAGDLLFVVDGDRLVGFVDHAGVAAFVARATHGV
jgi:Zn-dependent protease/CBS domain-containing protein